ncbi:MAG: hypothetical protein J1G06_01580 [Oscillospiraceae bacterium]|nr:hypothetical protein [Oscillospiraceae bacterium]
MDMNYAQSLVDMGVRLAELAVKGTTSAVNRKIRVAKEIKEVEKLRMIYDEIINEVLLEREEVVRIAQVYKSELDRIMISDEDIEHLHNTVSRILEIFTAIQLASAALKGEEEICRVAAQAESYKQIKELISVDTLKTMQLLGFNYKAAIGEPLTQLCADAISAFGQKNKTVNTSKKH